MDKSKFLMVLIGIFLITTRIWVDLGIVTIDITHDTIGFILITIGLSPIRSRNSIFKKSFVFAILGIIASFFSQTMLALQWGDSAETMHSAAIGILLIFIIYFTYYFTQALIMEARVQEKQAVTRNYQLSWFLMCAFIFIHFLVFKSAVSAISVLTSALIIILSLYYCSTVYGTAMQLFEE